MLRPPQDFVSVRIAGAFRTGIDNAQGHDVCVDDTVGFGHNFSVNAARLMVAGCRFNYYSVVFYLSLTASRADAAISSLSNHCRRLLSAAMISPETR